MQGRVTPGRNTAVDSHALRQGTFPTQGSNPRLLSPALQAGSLLPVPLGLSCSVFPFCYSCYVLPFALPLSSSMHVSGVLVPSHMDRRWGNL